MTVNPRRPISLRTATSLGNVQPVPGTGGSGKDTGKSAELMNAELVELRDAQPMTTICTRFGTSFVGLTGESRDWFRAHLAEKHPEVKVPRRRRSGGSEGDVGVTVVLSRRPGRRSRAGWYAEVKRMKGQGMTGTAIASRLGISHSFVYSLLHDPDGTRDRERKRSYAGTCIDCGSPTDGSNGSNTPERCYECAQDYRRVVLKYWTRERVLDAIQRFAAVHGRPPKANEWIAGDPVNGYPPRSQVYRSSRQSPPFASWADAIEAAGFPRPRIGEYERTGEIALKEAGLYALRRTRERGEQGITARMLADERGVLLETAWQTLNGLVRRGLLYRAGTVGGGRGNGYPRILYKAVSPTTETD